MFNREPEELYDSLLVRRRYRVLSGAPKPIVGVFRLLESRGPLSVRDLIQLSGYKKSRVYEALRLLRTQRIIEIHKGLCYLIY